MHSIFLGFISVLLAAAAPQPGTNSDAQQAGPPVSAASTNNPEQAALDKVMGDDDATLDQVDSWIKENNAFAADGAGESKAQLNEKIQARLREQRQEYENFLKQYPTNAAAYLAFGSYLDNIGDEEGASVQYEKSRQLDPKNPAVWNNLANYYGENGPVTNAFAYYSRAIDLDPTEPVYYENWATTVYLFRKDAKEFYGIDEAQVFDKALALYQKAIQLDPTNFELQTDYAESYYGIKPLRTNDALVAWTNALKVAQNDFEREGVWVHLARVKMLAGNYAEASAQLNVITNSAYQQLRDRLVRDVAEREQEAATNAARAPAPAPAASGQKMP